MSKSPPPHGAMGLCLWVLVFVSFMLAGNHATDVLLPPDVAASGSPTFAAAASNSSQQRRNLHFVSLCPGDNNVRIDGLPMPMRDVNAQTSLWLIPIRFVGPTAFSPQANPVGVLRCELFARLTLPSVVAAVNNPPPRTRVRVIFINDSAIAEPTCAKIIEKTKKLLGDKMSFDTDTHTFLRKFTLTEDLLFITRLDSDDAVGPNVLIDIHSAFVKASMPTAILSPFTGNLYYPFAGNGSCGQMIYNALVRKFPIFQTSAYDKAWLTKIMELKQPLLEFFLTPEGKYYTPYSFGHKHPDEWFTWFRQQFAKSPMLRNWPCGSSDQCVSDCALFFFSSSPGGIPGIIYTQSGLQSSLARSGHTDVDTLKYHENYDEAWEKTSPDVCQGLEYFHVVKQDIVGLRDIYKKNKASYEGHLGDVFTQQPGNRGGKKYLPSGKPVKGGGGGGGGVKGGGHLRK